MHGSLFLSGIVPLLLLGAIGYSCLRTVVMGLTLPRPLRNRHGGGVCGFCHYPVTHGHTRICPECGRPHADAGILTPSLAKPTRPTASSVVAAWFVLHVVIYIALMVALSAIVSSLTVDGDQWILVSGLALALLFAALFIAALVWTTRRRRRLFAPPKQQAEGEAQPPT